MALLPFDETGTLASNLKRESHAVNTINSTNLNYIIPKWAPFFKTGFTVFHVDSGRYLDEGVDFFFSHYFELADEKLADKIYGSISFIDPNITGTFKLSMQSLGGDFVTNATQLLTNGLDTVANLSAIKWEDIVTPATFPPTSHEHVETDLEGVNAHLGKMERIVQAIESHFTELSMSDIKDLGSGFVSPLMTNLQALTTATISANAAKSILAYHKALFTEETDGTEDINLGALTAGTWYDTPLTVFVIQAGEYRLDHAVDALIASVGSSSLLFRWTFNGVAIARSAGNGLIHTVPANTNLRLQVKAVGDDLTGLTLSNSDRASSITATYISN